MAVKYRLNYANDAGTAAVLDISVNGYSGAILTIEGTEKPFILSYKGDKDDKSLSIMSTTADIEIYATEDFNIDVLKTSSETDLRVDFYTDGVVRWSGFILPDFFSEEIGLAKVVRMTATDRLSTLKAVSLNYTSDKSLRELLIDALAETGLTLQLKTMVDFTLVEDESHIFMNTIVNKNRLVDDKNKKISCYDLIQSILVTANAKLVQVNGMWLVVNKYQHEQGIGNLFTTAVNSSPWVENTVSFSDVVVGARREIIPVAAEVGIFHEHGGSDKYPNGYDFQQPIGVDAFTGWSVVDWAIYPLENDFVVAVNDKVITGYTNISPDVYTPIYGISSNRFSLKNDNVFTAKNVLSSNEVRIPYYGGGQVNVDVNVNVTGQGGSWQPVIVEARNVVTNEKLFLHDGKFINHSYEIEYISFVKCEGSPFNAVSASGKITGVLNCDDFWEWDIKVHLFAAVTDYSVSESGVVTSKRTTNFINSASVSFSSPAELPQGNLIKTVQGGIFTNKQEIETTVFGDYLTSGINGYFYSYPYDDTSSFLGLTTNGWKTAFDTEELPMLLHSVRQRSRMFGQAHDLLTCEISINDFNPLSIFTDCNSKRYVVVSADFDFLNSVVNISLEEITYDTSILRKDYIYSYFSGAESDNGIKNISGISGTSGGGGMTAGQLDLLNKLSGYWKLDTDGKLYTELDVYSTGEVSAYGAGTGGGGSVTALSQLTDVTLTSVANNDILKYDTATSKWVNVPIPTASSVYWDDVLNKPTTFVPAAHPHAIADISNLQSALNGKQSYDFDLDAIANLSGTVGYLRKTAANSWELKDESYSLSGHPHTKEEVGLGNVLNVASYSKTESDNLLLLKVDKVTGKSLILDTEITRLAGVTNQTLAGLGGEPAFSKNTGFNKNFGTTAGTVSEGSHTHTAAQIGLGNVTNESKATMFTNPVFTGVATAPTFVGALSGNASTATKLATARTIWGVSFDGTNNVAGHLDLVTSDLTWGGFANGKTTIKGTTDGLIVYPTGINGTGNIFVNSNGVYHAGNANRTDVNWTAATLTAQTDVLINGITATDKSIKNFMNAFNNAFDLTGGVIKAKQNLYSVGEITAYNTGSGVSGLKLMGDLDANVHAITNVSYLLARNVYADGSAIGESQNDANYYGLYDTNGDCDIAVFNANTDKYRFANGNMIVNGGVNGTTTVKEIKFGNYSFKQDGYGRLGIYNGTTEIACFNADGTYVNL